MKVLIEAMAADFGGIRTYVVNLLDAWGAAHPEDELLVLVTAGSDVPTGSLRRLELAVPKPVSLGRPLVQALRIRRIVAREGVDVVLATVAGSAVRRPGVPLAVVVHDLRHELRPEQFSRWRRLLRGVSYSLAYRLADVIVAVSQRTLDDLHRLHPRVAVAPGQVVHHGADHALAWAGAPGSGPAVAFAHHTNKNPDLLLDAWADGQTRGLSMPPVRILGTGSERQRLADRAAGLGVAHLIELMPYLPDVDFERAIGEASMVVFPSDFEGFGLPIVEGMIRGVPVVIGPDPAALEVAGGHASVMRGWSPGDLADAVVAAAGFDREMLEAAERHAAAFTWRRCAQETRSVLAAAVARSSAGYRPRDFA